jgi:hypothetical protein
MDFLRTEKGKKRKMRLFLIPVFAVFVFVSGYALSRFLKGSEEPEGVSVREEGGLAESEQAAHDGLGEERPGVLRRVSGFVGEISQGKTPGEKTIRIRVPQTLDENPSRQRSGDEPSKEYLFSLSEGETGNIRERRPVTVYFFGEPSESSPVPVQKVRLGRGG